MSYCSTTEHVGDVRAIVQRAVKDLLIEESLKTYEEVWLSKVFEMRDHVRNKVIANEQKEAATKEEQNVSKVLNCKHDISYVCFPD